MSDDEAESRKRLHSPVTDGESKKLREEDIENTQHVSVQLIGSKEGKHTKERPPTPVSVTAQNISPTNLGSLFILNDTDTGPTPPKRKISSDRLYTMIIGLEMRLFKQENDLVHQAQEVAELKERLQQKEEVIEELKQHQITPCKYTPAESDFVSHLKRELPNLSDGCAKNEADIRKLSADISEGLAGIAANGRAGGASVDGGVDFTNGIQRVSEDLKNMNDRVIKSSRRVHLEGEQRDQYSRREIVRITGVPYVQGEDTNNIMCRIACSLGVEITPADISVSHRSGKRINENPRPILCKFARRDTKHRILANKKFARNIKFDDMGNPVRIFLDEDLTPMRARICKKLRAENTRHHTKDGKLFVTSGDDQFQMYDTPRDWEGLDWSDETKIYLGIYPRV